MNVYIENTACTRRKLDVSKLHSYFEVNGYNIATKADVADYIVVPTCALKKEEEEHSLKLLDSFRNSSGKVIVYGCLPVIARSRYSRNFNFDFLSPAELNDIDRYFMHITHRFSDVADANVLEQQVEDLHPPGTDGAETCYPLRRYAKYVRNKYLGVRPLYYLFTSRGCTGSCSYCAARFAIGPLKSKPLNVLIKEFNRGIEAGYRHFFLIGDDVGAYGTDGELSFPALLGALVSEAEKPRGGTASNASSTIRINIDEFHPRWLVKYREEMLELLSRRCISSLFCPIQSGNDRILGLMQRGNEIASTVQRLHDINRRNPGLRLNTKILAGFPTETEGEFLDTLVQVGNLPVSSVAIVPYEEKENTPACNLEPKVPAAVIAERVAKAHSYFRDMGIRTFSNIANSA